jgi:hypothetical protein
VGEVMWLTRRTRPLGRAGPDRVGIDPGRPYDAHPGALGQEVEEKVDASVLVAGREDLVVRTERERSEHGVQTVRRVEDEHEVVRGRPDVSAERRAHRGELIVEPAVE